MLELIEKDIGIEKIETAITKPIQALTKQIVELRPISETYTAGLTDILDKKPSVPTGFTQFDDHIKIRHGELTSLVSRASEGKTTLAVQLSHKIAQQGNPTLYVAMEMTAGEINRKHFRREGTDDQIMTENLDSVFSREEFGRMYILPGNHTTGINQVEEVIAQIKAGITDPNKFLVVFIDPIQRIKTGDSNSDFEDVRRIGLVMQRLKDVAIRQQVCIICLSDTTKSGEGMNFKGGYDIEQISDICLFMFSDNNYNRYRVHLNEVFGNTNTRQGETSVIDNEISREIDRKIIQMSENLSGDRTSCIDCSAIYILKNRHGRRFEFIPFEYHKQRHLFIEVPPREVINVPNRNSGADNEW